MMRNLTFSLPWKNKLTKAEAFGRYAIGAALAVLAGVWTGDGEKVLIVALVGLLFRLWKGIPMMHSAIWGAELLAGGLAAGLAEEVARNGREEWLTMAYWSVFFILLIAFCIADRHFLLSAGAVTLLMILCLSPYESVAWKSAAMAGAVCGCFPGIEKKQGNITII